MSDLLGPALAFAALTALSALVARLALSAYHDGLRPLMPEFRRREIDARTMAGRAYDMDLGFVLYFALPFALATGVLVSHLVLLPADVIGVRFRRRTTVLVLAAVVGAGVFLAIRGLTTAFEHLPVDFGPDLELLVFPLGLLLGVMPALAVAYQYGLRWGAAVLVVAIAVRMAVRGSSALDAVSGLSADGVALLAGTVLMLALALRRRGEGSLDARKVFAENIRNLRRGLPFLLPIGALAALLAHWSNLAGEPAANVLVGSGRLGDAALVGVFSAAGFMPLVVDSSVVTGAHSTQGYPDWVLAAGYLSPSPIVGAVAGAGVMAVELLGVGVWSRLLGRFPDLRELGASIRQALTTTTDLAMLVGGLVSANAIWQGQGALLVGGMYLLNEVAGRPVMRMAIGPIGAIAAGLIVNVLHVV